MADSETTQQVTSKRVTAREAHEKALAETPLAETPLAETPLAETPLAETPSAEPAKNVFTKTQRQRIIIKALSDLNGALPRDHFFEVAKAIAKHADFSCDVDNAEQLQKRAEREALAEAKRDAHEKLLAEARAIIANCRQKRAERKALAEAKRDAHEKLLAEARAIIANCRQKRAERKALAEAKQAKREAFGDTPSAEPFLTTSQWLILMSIASSLGGF